MSLGVVMATPRSVSSWHPIDGRWLRAGRLRADQGRDRLRPIEGGSDTAASLKLASCLYGPALLAVVAAGLAGFALYSMADARYRKV